MSSLEQLKMNNNVDQSKELDFSLEWNILLTKYKLYITKPNNNFKINWGCSSKGVLDYKVKKWPVYSLEDKWFLTIKNT